MKTVFLVLLAGAVLFIGACESLGEVPAPTLQPSPTPFFQATPTPQVVDLNWAAFPLAKGAYWVYKGRVEWQEGSEVREQELTWKMEVVETVEREQVKGYLLQGHLYDLVWYEPGRERQSHVIIQVGPKYYNSDLEGWNRLNDGDDFLVDLVDESQIFLDLPLWPEKFFGETPQFTRLDGSYRWVVGEEQAVQLKEVKGVSPEETRRQYSLRFQTLPDHQVAEFVPGVGITHYIYGHHGTVSEVDMRLVEYQPGQ